MLEVEDEAAPAISQDDLPPGYTVTELGLLPDDWRVVPLGDTAKIRGETVDPSQRPELRYVGLEHIVPGEIRIGTWGGAKDVRSAKSAFYAGDLLYGKLRPYLEKGAVAKWPGMSSTDILVLTPNGAADPTYLGYLIHTPRFVAHAVATTTGVNHPRTSWNALRAFPLALPPLPEQRAIADVLSTVQRAKAATEATVAATRELKKSLMRHLFTYGPVPVDQAERVRLKETEYGTLPEPWRIEPLRQRAVVQTGLTKGRKLQGPETVSLPYLRVANVQDGYLDLTQIKEIDILPSEFRRYALQSGDVLLTEGGDFDKLGRGFIWKDQVPNCLHQNHIFAVRASRDSLWPEYLAYLVQSDYGKRYFLTVAHRTTHLACINSTKLRALPVPLPTLQEQHEIVRQLEVMDCKLGAEESREQALQALFETLLHDLMAGKVRVVYAPEAEDAR